MAIDQVTHRPGGLKQVNKSHKHGKHRSKGTLDALTKGRVSVKSLSQKKKKELSREARRHQAEQLRRNKREEILSKKRGLGGSSYAPFLVCVLPLNKNLDPFSAIETLKACDSEAVVTLSPNGVTHISLPRFKQRFSLVVPNMENDFFVLDTLKVCDTVLCLVSATEAGETCDDVIDEWGSNLLSAAISQALPTSCVAIMNLASIAPKKRNETKQEIQKLITRHFPEEKAMVLDTNSDALNILRRIGNQKQKSVFYRDRRPHLYSENYEYIADDIGTMGTLKISGYLRGGNLSVNGLIHIPGLGDFQMSRIEAENHVHSFSLKKDDSMDESMQIMKLVLDVDPTKQESLMAENEALEEEMGEQTWPTKEDYEEAAKEQKGKKLVKRVPKGWSPYQAAWIPDEDAEEVSDSDDDEDNEDMEFADAMSQSDSDESNQDEDEYETVTESEIGASDEKYDEQIDLKSEKLELEKIKAAKSDMMFPDEIDTPLDGTARERFQKYRGLESFRTSTWDPKENLPTDYSRIFQFENFDRTKRRIFKEQEALEDGAKAGWFITIHVLGVSQQMWSSFSATKSPVVVVGLLPHEHKMSLLNVLLKRTSNYSLPIKSKERLIFQCGYRRFIVNPIFSEHTFANKHKYNRFFQPDSTSVASFFAPIQFPPSPVLCYKEINGRLVLVATGSLLSVNANRMVIKRIVLSGHTYKVHKRSAVVRFMFFNREDIKYFQPVKLRTKYGRVGHIKEPLGTHGHMKCIFNGQLKSQDTVLMSLYKRVFPKWNYEPCLISCNETEEMQE